MSVADEVCKDHGRTTADQRQPKLRLMTLIAPAFAYSIATANSSAKKSARALVVLVTEDPRMQTGGPTWTNEKTNASTREKPHPAGNNSKRSTL